MPQMNFATYGSFAAVTKSDTTLVTCRAIYVGGAGNVAISPTAAGVDAVTITGVPAGAILPFNLEQGRIMSTNTTATAIVALN